MVISQINNGYQWITKSGKSLLSRLQNLTFFLLFSSLSLLHPQPHLVHWSAETIPSLQGKETYLSCRVSTFWKHIKCNSAVSLAQTWDIKQTFWIGVFHICTPWFHLVAAEAMGTGANWMPINRKGYMLPENLEAGMIFMYLGL